MAQLSDDELKQLDALVVALARQIAAIKAREAAAAATAATTGYPATRLTRRG